MILLCRTISVKWELVSGHSPSRSFAIVSPRRRGAARGMRFDTTLEAELSPPARGIQDPGEASYICHWAIPAHTGMIPAARLRMGDTKVSPEQPGMVRSNRGRRWDGSHRPSNTREWPFPTSALRRSSPVGPVHAGMVPPRDANRNATKCRPRTARGWSRSGYWLTIWLAVGPAKAGMVRDTDD